MLRKPQENEGRTKSIVETVLILFVWIMGLAAAAYLVYDTFYLLYLAIVFGFNAPPTPIAGYIVFVLKNAIPAAIFVGIGLLGLLAWPSGRFWPLGLSAILFETAFAIYDIANPTNTIILDLVPQ